MQHHSPYNNKPAHSESGNIIFFILLGIVLIGLVTAAIRSVGGGGANIDREELTLRAAQVRQYAQELERAVHYVMQRGPSETTLRFAIPGQPASDYGDIADNPATQIFSDAGGGAEYRAPPAGINDGSSWEFYAHTRIPGAGTDRADLIAVLPHVTAEFCDYINRANGQTGAPRETGGGCIHDTALRFNDTNQYEDSSPNLLDEDPASFSRIPALQACVDCSPGSTPEYHFYHVLRAR